MGRLTQHRRAEKTQPRGTVLTRGPVVFYVWRSNSAQALCGVQGLREMDSFPSGVMGKSLRTKCSLTLLRKVRRVGGGEGCSRGPRDGSWKVHFGGTDTKVSSAIYLLKNWGEGAAHRVFLCCPGWPQSYNPHPCLSLLSAEGTGMCYHVWLT